MARRKTILIATIFLMVLSSGSICLGKYTDGTGEPNDPYIISTAEDLNDIGNHTEDFNKCFLMVADINLADYTGTQFNIIGNDSSAFTGVFDGNDHIISNFTYHRNSTTGVQRIGIFGYACEPQVKIERLTLSNPCVDVNAVLSYSEVGALVGHFRDGVIESCSVQNGNITSMDYTAGGLVGSNFGTIIDCYSNAKVYGGVSSGGLVGDNFGDVANCYATGTVQAYNQAGGFIGYLMEGNIINCYAACNVSAEFYEGGLIGFYHHGFFTKCFWNSSINPLLLGMGNEQPVGTAPPDPNIIGKPIAEMMTKSTFTDAGWDFVFIWDLTCEGMNYPRFIWQIAPVDYLCPHGVDFKDYSFFAGHWMDSDCGDANDCDGCDLDFSDMVDANDLKILCDHWLAGTTP